MKPSKASRIALYLVLAVFAIAFLAPLAYIVINSFKPAAEIFKVPQQFLPHDWTLDNYHGVFSGRFTDFFVTSAFITVGGVLVVVILSALAGYGFAKFRFPGVNGIFLAITGTITIPVVIFLVPMFLMENAVGILNTRLGLLLPNIAITLPFAVLIMRSQFIAIPAEIEESAVVDGAGVLRRWWSIMLPMARNGAVLVVIMTAYEIWGEYTIAKALTIDPNVMPLSVGLTLLKGEVWDYGVLAAVIVMAVLPPVIIFLLFQKRIVAGMAQGSVKG